MGAWWIGPRIKQDLDDFQPNNIIMMLVGAGILWVGWNGFVSISQHSLPDLLAYVLIVARTVVILTLRLLMLVQPF